MALKDQVMSDIKTAMKAGDQSRLTVLRGLSSSFKNKAIEKSLKAGAETELSDEEAQAVVLAEAKKRKDAIAAFSQAGRAELAQNEERELEMLQQYLPKQLSPEEVEKEVDAIIAASDTKEFGPLIKTAMAALRGKADGALVTELIKKKLG